MYRNVLTGMVLILACTFLAMSVAAEPPQYINYQGRLTDDAGEPITNISPGVVMTFTIWNDESLSDPGNEEWGAANVYVPVEDGLFEYQLGPLPANLFRDNADLWLGIKVSGDAEISPRSKLISAAYACHAGTVDDIYVNETGDVMTGDLVFDGLGNGETDGIIDVTETDASLKFYYEETQLVSLGSGFFGYLNLAFSDNGIGRASLSAQPAGGYLSLNNSTGTGEIELMAGVSGDYSVMLPDDAINSDEILDEPGLTSTINVDYVYLSAGVMTDIETIDIDIPAAGYIKVEGWCAVDFINFLSSGHQYAYVQIDETSGGTYSTGYYNACGQENFAMLDQFAFPLYVSRIYYKSSEGTFQFRLEGQSIIANRCDVICINSNLIATYYPTSYAAVKAVTSDPGDYSDPTAVTAVDPITKTEKTMYQIDLRYYELKAKDARMKALEAELELRHKQLEEARQSAGRETGQ